MFLALRNLQLTYVALLFKVSKSPTLCISFNRPRSIYVQYSNMPSRLSRQTAIFVVVFFVIKSLSGIERQKKLNLKNCNLDPNASQPSFNIDISKGAYYILTADQIWLYLVTLA